jgi:cyanophycin synthetase
VQLELQRQGLSATAVPAAGRRVLIQHNGNVSIDCTDAVHPEVEHAVSLAARVVGLDIAGIDLVCEDISRPLQEQGGAIVEVNAGPGLLMHLKPAEGTPRPVGQAIVNHLFAEDASGRIPIIGIAGSMDTHRIARLVAWLVHLSGRLVGLACRDGLFLGSRQVEKRDGANWAAGHRLLINREVHTVVLENGPASILDDGLAYDRCQVGVITDLGGAEGLARHDVQSDEQLVRVLRTQMDVVLPDGVGVLNAADPRVVDLARLCDGEVLLYAEDGQNEALVSHRATGGRAVFVRDQRLVLATGAAEQAGIALRGGRRRDPALTPAVLLAGVATAWASGIAPELITAGIETFDAQLALVSPGQH